MNSCSIKVKDSDLREQDSKVALGKIIKPIIAQNPPKAQELVELVTFGGWRRDKTKKTDWNTV